MTVTLLHGDCQNILKDIPTNSVDLILTDPPYYKVKGDYWDRQWDTPQGFLDWLDGIMGQYYSILKPNGSLYMFASPDMSDRVSLLIRRRFNVLNHVVWKKEGGTRANQADKESLRHFFGDSERIIFAEHYGADGYAKGEAGYDAKCDELRGFVFEPLRAYLDGERQRAGVSKSQCNGLFGGPNVTQYWWQQRNWQLPTKEHYETLRAGLSALNHGGEYLKRDYEDLKRDYEDLKRDYEDLRRPFSVSADVPYTDVWTFKTVSTYPGKHPCEKPLDMLEHIIKASSKPGAVVLDSFMGTGNTGIAAQRLGRSFIGIEKDKKYFERAEQRITQAQMVMPL